MKALFSVSLLVLSHLESKHVRLGSQDGAEWNQRSFRAKARAPAIKFYSSAKI